MGKTYKEQRRRNGGDEKVKKQVRRDQDKRDKQSRREKFTQDIVD